MRLVLVCGMMVLMVWVFILFVGLCLGSFVNALVWRLHEQEGLKQKKTKDIGKRLRDLSIAKGRSMCPHCHHILVAKDLVPVLSWLSLGGKCRYCSKPIGWQYPAVELAVAAAAIVSYLAWPYAANGWTGVETVTFGVWLLLLTGFMALTVYDLKWYLLPDRIVAPLTAIAAVFVLGRALSEESHAGALVGSLVGALIIAGLFYGLYQLSSGKWIGGGDVKLAVLLGLLAGGAAEALLLLFLASTAGTVYSLVAVVLGRQKLSRKLRIPFGPFLLLGAFIVVIWGTAIIDWYTDLLIAA